MPSKVQTSTGFKDVIDRKVSNGDGTFTDVVRTVEWHNDGNHVTLWERGTPAASNCTWDNISQQYFTNAGTGICDFV
jgi:hypothetical protein